MPVPAAADHAGDDRTLQVAAAEGLFGSSFLVAQEGSRDYIGQINILVFEGVAHESQSPSPFVGPRATAMYCADAEAPPCRLSNPQILEFDVDERGVARLEALDDFLGRISLWVAPDWGPGARSNRYTDYGFWGSWSWRSRVVFESFHPRVAPGPPEDMGIWTGALRGTVGGLYLDPDNYDNPWNRGHGGHTFRAAHATARFRWQTLHWS